MRQLFRPILLGFILMGFMQPTNAQFYQVYGYTNLDANEKEVVMWNTYIPSSDHDYSFFGETVPRTNLLAHSLEVEYGITSRMTVAAYLDFEQPSGHNPKWIRSKAVMVYYRFAEKNMLPIDFALYGEYKLPRKGYKDYEELEFKIIMEKDYKAHRFVLNPTFEKKISGADVNEKVEFVLNGSYTWMRSLTFQPKIEYYSKIGELYEPHIYGEQKNYIFPSFDLFFGSKKQFRWHAGVGFGLTDPADNLIVKSVISWEFF